MSVSVSANLNDLIALRDDLKITPQRLAEIATQAVNHTALQALQNSRKLIVNQVNLPAQYVEEKTQLQQATEQNPIAIITARGRGTQLVRFDSKQIITPAKNPKKAKGGGPGGIPSGYKAAGVSVNVKRGAARAELPHGFFMKLRNGNGYGLFTRSPDGKIRNRYGPSVDQVFVGVIRDTSPQIAIDLEQDVIARLDGLLGK
ncbi:phage tail protein [Undibacterium sp. Di26W]|uniref:phage tail protein n=1 Tax=Undibacterium sp. Di26W TaxID=3413035 RepID=UPI003BF09DB7